MARSEVRALNELSPKDVWNIHESFAKSKKFKETFTKGYDLWIYFWLCQVFVATLRVSLAAASEGYSPGVARGLLVVVASLVAEQGLWGTPVSVVTAFRLQSSGSGVVLHGLSCLKAREVFPEQGWNLCLLHRQAGS